MIGLSQAMSAAEWHQIQQTGTFEVGPHALGGKFFAENITDARQWGELLNGPGNSFIIEVELPAEIAEQFMRWERLDGIGPARYGEITQLHGAIIKEVTSCPTSSM